MALGYNNDDITTSHVFQALKLAGYELDEQAEAQVRMADLMPDRPERISKESIRLAGFLPWAGWETPVLTLMPLHTQAHRYDQEAAERFTPKPPQSAGPEL
jgi:hypothetical protein